MTRFVCFGEVLWDVFPKGKIIGGAPLNVAYRLQSFGNNVQLISKVGQDVLGEKIISFLKESNLNTDAIQIDKNLSTGKVNIKLDSSKSATYEIVNPVAWDQIKLTNENKKAVKHADVFIYGSLCARERQSRHTLYELLQLAKYKVFDVNLRAPHYDKAILFKLMNSADLIKLNDEELNLISSYFEDNSLDIETQMKTIANKTNTQTICVTKGAQGAIILDGQNIYTHQGYQNHVVDTVGAGDAFLATLLHFKQTNIDLQKALHYATAMGALVVGSKGGTNFISLKDLLCFIDK